MNIRRVATRWVVLVIAGLVVAIDQAAKAAARAALPTCVARGCAHLRLLGVDLVRVDNAGSALGFAQGRGVWIVVALVATIVATLVALRSVDPLSTTGAALLAGGGVANLLDRLATGGVTDFIRAGRVVYNPADLFLLIGMVVLTMGRMRAGHGADAAAGPLLRTASSARLVRRHHVSGIGERREHDRVSELEDFAALQLGDPLGSGREPDHRPNGLTVDEGPVG
jgi:signal peptidase II